MTFRGFQCNVIICCFQAGLTFNEMTFTIRKTRITRNETFLFQFISFHGDLEPLGMEHFYLRKIYMPNNMIHSWYQLTYSSSSLNDTVWWPLHFDIGFLEWKIYWHWKTAKIEEKKQELEKYSGILKHKASGSGNQL